MPVETFTIAAQPSEVGVARRRVVDQLTAWLGPLGECGRYRVALVTSELVTNGLRYGRAEGCAAEDAGRTVEVEVCTTGVGTVVIAVTDDNPAEPTRRDACDNDEGGRGLLLVADEVIRQGVIPLPGKKKVWAEIGLAEDFAIPPPKPAVRTIPCHVARRRVLDQRIREMRPEPRVGDIGLVYQRRTEQQKTVTRAGPRWYRIE